VSTFGICKFIVENAKIQGMMHVPTSSSMYTSRLHNVCIPKFRTFRLVTTSATSSVAVDDTRSGEPLKVSMVSLGCPKNTVDGEVLLGDLFKSGFTITEDHANSDAIVINTCGFVEDAKNESLDTIMAAAKLKSEGKIKKLVITGCLAQRYSEELAEQIPEADLIVGFEKYPSLPSQMKAVLDAPPDLDSISSTASTIIAGGRVQVGAINVGFRPEWDRHRLTPQHTAYLRVAEGCSHSCTFCAIPNWR
jgi:ribosomal protein S12 methylthiotransferase